MPPWAGQFTVFFFAVAGRNLSLLIIHGKHHQRYFGYHSPPLMQIKLLRKTSMYILLAAVAFV